MAIRHISDLKDDAGKSYADVEAFKAEHGPCGANNPGCTGIQFEILDPPVGIRRTIIFEDQAQFDAFFPNLTTKAFTVTKIEKVEL
jgi:hypothetical protein